MIQRSTTLKLVTTGLLVMGVSCVGVGITADKPATKKTEPIKTQVVNDSMTPAAKAKMANATYTPIDVMALVKEPEQFKEQYIRFDATFNSFSTLGLDYPKAERSSTDYISVVVLRPDVQNHHIPMSELKLFFPRKDSDSVLELESGDKVAIKGHVFSSALNDPWVDITELTVIEKAAPKKEANDE